MTLRGKLHLTAVLVAVGLPVSLTAARTAWQQSAKPTLQVDSTNGTCPSQNDLDAMLSKASTLMGQTRYQDAIDTLKSLSGMGCDARISLLLAGAVEAGGDVPQAIEVLKQAHSVWPANNSIAASLAREYSATGQLDKAVTALAHFHPTAKTPLQEMEMAVVVDLAAHQLLSAHTAAEWAYKSYPSVHTLLLLANALQLQGRYPEVIRLLESQRRIYANSPDFFITLAESEFDASIYPAARQDLEHAISQDPKSYQAHYLLGNVLFRLNDVDRAVSEYRLAIDLAPDQPRTYFQLALALRSKQDEAGEKRALEQALAGNGHYAPAQCEMGRILLEENRASDAVSHLSLATQFNPKSEEAYFLLARAYTRLGEKDKSKEMVKMLETVRKGNRPDSPNENGSHSASNQAIIP